MRWLWLTVWLVAGCYSPTAATGAPCTPGVTGCPTGQTCVLVAGDYRCETEPEGATDARVGDGGLPDGGLPIDAPVVDPLGDEDGDGVLNKDDNCVFAANANQHDEDGDPFGDVCDKCPPFPSTTDPDMDSDGVGDACDPHPNTGGDALYLFEGFGSGVPSGGGWAIFGTFTASMDDVTANVADGAHATLRHTAPSGTSRVYTAATVTSVTTGTAYRGVGVVEIHQANSDSAIMCAVLSDPTLGLRLSVVDTSTETLLATSAYEMTVGETYQLQLERSGTTYTCDADRGGTKQTASSGSSLTAAQPEIGLRVHGAGARFKWLMVVTSP